MEYNLNRPWETLDEWQKEYISYEGNCFLLTGRQCGKSTAMSIKAATIAATKNNSNINFPFFTI